MDLFGGYSSSGNPKDQLACWLKQLQEYDFEVIHRPGHVCGRLSPSDDPQASAVETSEGITPAPSSTTGDESHTSETHVMATRVGQPLGSTSLRDLQGMQLEDANLGPILEAKEKGQP